VIPPTPPTPATPPLAALKAALFSAALSVWTVVAVVLAIGSTEGALSSPQATFAYLANHWWAEVISIIVNPGPFIRARQGFLNALIPNTKGTP
jgi:hypothetical protein